ncbi:MULTISPECIES: hypothetical protein [unclassified Xanthobacter]|uniref:hypothetical protein n=2 Tax=unclassified Xanthobacter TaxID=2623496 RepID=UPI001F36D1FE|nr:MULTISPECIES: hypothetical protein [unclassified Xanthobacter]
MRPFGKMLLAAGMGAGLVVWAGQASAATCFVLDPIWKAQHNSVQASLNSQVLAMQSALAASMTTTAQLLTSAMKVQTKQVDLEASRANTAKAQINQALASTINQQDINQRIVKAQQDYGIDTGQGVKVCKTIALMHGVNSALAARREIGLGAIAALDVAPGAVATAQEAVATRLESLDKVDASLLFDITASAADKAAVVAHMAGLPVDKPATLTTVGQVTQLQRARRVEALRSPALASLSAVAAVHTRGATGSMALTSSSDTSLSESLDELLKRYGGGADYEAWSAGLTGQSERGLLVELSRLRALALSLRQSDTEQRARLSVLKAALLAVETGGE